MLDAAIELIQTKDIMTHHERALVLEVLMSFKDIPEPEPQVVEIDGDVVIDYILDAFVHKYAELYMEHE